MTTSSDLDRAMYSMDRAARWGLNDLRPALAFTLNATENDFASDLYRVGLEASDNIASLEEWTFAREAAAYVANINGNLTLVASGEPRLSDRGLLIEGESTNLLLQSQEFGNRHLHRHGQREYAHRTGRNGDGRHD